MSQRFSRISAILAATAAACMVASPAMARGWGGSHYRHYRYHDGIDGGDILAGVLILGGIAAIASAANKADKDRRESEYPYPDNTGRPERDYAPDDNAPDSEPGAGRSYAGSGAVGDAVETCAEEIERGDRQIDSVESVVRDGDGWRVEGEVDGGRNFSCSVSDSGQIRSATVGGRAAYF